MITSMLRHFFSDMVRCFNAIALQSYDIFLVFSFSFIFLTLLCREYYSMPEILTIVLTGYPLSQARFSG